jgi:hypothetical protein
MVPGSRAQNGVSDRSSMKHAFGRSGSAWLISLVLHGLLLLFLAMLHLGLPDAPPPPSPGGGLALALGVEDGQAELAPSLPPTGSNSSTTEQTEPVSPTNTPIPSVTQDQEEAPVVTSKPETKPMDPRLQRLLQRQGQPNPNNSSSEAKRTEPLLPTTRGFRVAGAFRPAGMVWRIADFPKVQIPKILGFSMPGS